MKDRVEEKMLQEANLSTETLLQNIELVLTELEFDTNLFENLLYSLPSRFDAVKAAQGGNTDF